MISMTQTLLAKSKYIYYDLCKVIRCVILCSSSLLGIGTHINAKRFFKLFEPSLRKCDGKRKKRNYYFLSLF